MKKTILALVAFAAMGCTCREVQFGGAKYTSKRFGASEQFGKIELKQGTNSLTVEGVQSDLVTGIKVGVDAALKAAAAVAKP